MVRNGFTARVIATAAAVASCSIALPAVLAVVPLSLSISQESAPPGAMVQLKVAVTEPKPISTGKGRLTGVTRVSGISLRSPLNDAYGVAVVDASGLDLAVTSPASSFGTELDYPVLTVACRVPATLAMGATTPVDLEVGSLRLLDPAGIAYPVEVGPGSITAAPGVSVSNAVPGSADLPAGAVVVISGGGFLPGVRVRFGEAKLSAVRYVSPSEVRVVLAQPARMHGMRIRVDNPDGTNATYFSYQRTTRVAPSANPVLATAVPLYPYRFATTALVTAGTGVTALAVQNISGAAAGLVVELFRPDRSLARTIVGVLPSDRYAVRSLSELFGLAYQPGSIVRVRSSVPVQVMGITVDAAGDATPILPR